MQIVAEILGRSADTNGTDRLRHQWIHGKGMLRIDGFEPRREESARGNFQYII
jgi:hypothetical protein